MLLFWVYLVKYIVKITSCFFKVAIENKITCVSPSMQPGVTDDGKDLRLCEHASLAVTWRLLRGSRASRTPDISNNLTCRLSWGRAMIFWPTHTLILQREKKVPYKTLTAPRYSMHTSWQIQQWVLCVCSFRIQRPSCLYATHMCSMSLKKRGHNWLILILKAHYINLILYLNSSFYKYWVCIRGSMTNIFPGV